MQAITDTGMKGFLKWLQQFQPAVYAKIAAQLPSKAPQLFSDFEAAGGTLGAYQRGLSGLGDATTGLDLQSIDVTGDASSAIPTVDVADAANSGTTDSSSTDWLSSLINGVSQGFMTVTQAQTQQQLVNTQLQRAQAGLPPLSITPGTNGVPTISVAGVSGSKWLLAGGALLMVGLFMMKGRR